MTPNLRSVVAQAWRSTVASARNFSSSSEFNGGGGTVFASVTLLGLVDRGAAMAVGFWIGTIVRKRSSDLSPELEIKIKKIKKQMKEANERVSSGQRKDN